MKLITRNGVFETASSAVHCLSYKKNTFNSNLKVSDDGYIVVECGEYDDCELTTQEEKLGYVVTQLVLMDIKYRYERDVIEFPNRDYFWNIDILNDVIKEITGHNLRITNVSNATANHQIWGELPFNINHSMLKMVIFNDDISIIIDHD